ncbi:MAG: SGNH/GDSL hydrolase family protein [Roseateles sp.]|uniref:SGNH/GDSL hydrolase family protein n=1 Tax=Roseateles sp. TaxID=1971397 RepID=UPI0039E8E940
MSKHLFARVAAGFALCAAALSASAAGGYSGLVVFGDSLSDSGNNATLLAVAHGGAAPAVDLLGNGHFSKLTSAAGTYSDGKVWTQYLAESLHLPLLPSVLGGNNYAFGGAQTGVDGTETADGFPYSMTTQLAHYLGTAPATLDAGSLYIVAGGGNNVRALLETLAADPAANATDAQAAFAATVAGYATDMAGIVGGLRSRGAQHVLVMNTPDFGLTPLARATGSTGAATQLSWAMNQALDAALAGSGTPVFDMFSFLQAAVQSPAFSNTTDACGAAANHCDTATALFWDGIHPTTFAHQQLAAAVLATPVPEPRSAVLLALGLAALALGRRRQAARQPR